VTVAVVVATRDRPRLLDRCLEALAAQQRPPDEVIVVDDGSRGGQTAAVLQRHAAALPLRVLRREVSGGPGRARQMGWQAAAAAYVAFTDDDCRPTPGWLAALAAGAAPRHVRVGRTQPDPADGPLLSVFDRTMRVEAHDGRFSTCNVLYPRALLAELGGFDHAFDGYGEDSDLGQRARAAGASDSWVPEALVWHAVHRPGAVRSLRERRRVGEIVRLVRRHPELRREIWQGWFWKPEHRELLLAAAGVGVAVRAPLALVAAQRWVSRAPGRVRWVVPEPARGGRGWMLRQCAGLALIDGVELASCAAGSLRHRTLFL